MAIEQTWGNGKIRYSGSYNNILTEPAEIATYEDQIVLIMEMILRTQSGRILVGAIGRTARIMLIIPDAGTEINAATNWTSAKQAFPANLTFTDPSTQQPFTTTSGGSCTIIELTPSNYSHRDGVVSSADTGLFHEMCHGLHVMLGISQAYLPLDDFDNIDEFWAITLTNIYLSEKNYPALRRDHHGRQQLHPSLCTSEAFLQRFADPMKQICDAAPDFTREVAQIPAKFNPIRAYYAPKTPNKSAQPLRR
jgi:hypothetical protein